MNQKKCQTFLKISDRVKESKEVNSEVLSKLSNLWGNGGFSKPNLLMGKG